MNKKYYYDSKSDSLYICIKEGEEESFEELAPGINIELGKTQDILGVEVLQASRFFQKENQKIKAKSHA